MTRQAIESYLYLMDAGFEGPDWHSLLSNLNTVAPEDWEWDEHESHGATATSGREAQAAGGR
jgi:hypothetical protein